MTHKIALTTAEAAVFLGIGENTLANSRYGQAIGGRPGPKYRKVGKKVLYLVTDLEAWIEQFGPSEPETLVQSGAA